MAVYYGNASGPIPEVDLSMLAQMGSLSVARTALKDHVRDAAEIEWRSGNCLTSGVTANEDFYW